jgi:hypothetical protein
MRAARKPRAESGATDMRTLSNRVLLVVATLLLTVGILAGVLNREVLDGSRFSAHADAVRSDANVSQLVGVAISDRVIALDQNLVALRPAIEAVMGQLVKSSVFTPVVEAAARQVHDALTNSGSGQILLRLADVGAVVVAALKTFAPSIAQYLPAEFDVTLADVGSQGYADKTLRLTRLVSLLDWLLPLLAVACFAVALWISRRRQRTLALIGLAIAASGALVAIVYAIASIVSSSIDTDYLRGALVVASWNQLGPAVWRAAVIVTVGGCIIFAAASAYLPQWSIADIGRRVIAWLRSPGEGTRSQLVAAAVLVAVGALGLFRPLATARVLVELLALAVLADGIARIGRVSARQRDATEEAGGAPPRPPRRWALASVALIATVGLVAFLVVSSLPADRKITVSALTSTTDPAGCNGYVDLCARPYNDVAYASTHNSMAAANEPGWFLPEQPTSLVGQLNAGVRALLIDSWYGQETNRKGVITNSGSTIAEAFSQANQAYGSAVVDSALRLRSALNLVPRGPVTPYLCHQICALGSTAMLPALQGVQQWMAAHPREVVTFIIEDYISAADTVKVIQEAGLMPYVHTQVAGQPWPSLQQMIDSGQRLQVFDQTNPGGAANPWLLKAWDWIQDTPYDNASQSALSCDLLRGKATHPLFLMNNFITRFDTRVSDSIRLNAYSTLWPYVSKCEKQRGQVPNFVAVDYYNQGNVFAVVNSLNGVS